MDGVKCGPGLKCQFYSEEDDFGDEFGICKGKEQSLEIFVMTMKEKPVMYSGWGLLKEMCTCIILAW